MSELSDLINKKVLDIAKQHAKVIDDTCKGVLEKFNISHDKLILEYQSDASIKIKIEACHFKITNVFTINDGEILNG